MFFFNVSYVLSCLFRLVQLVMMILVIMACIKYLKNNK